MCDGISAEKKEHLRGRLHQGEEEAETISVFGSVKNMIFQQLC